jgi:CheY-like chemotaxis protein
MVNKLLSGRHILIVEDEMMIQMFVEDILASHGASFASAPSIDRALALIDSQAFDAALLDVSLYGNRSYPVAEALKARGVPFIFSTGDIDLADGYEGRVPDSGVRAPVMAQARGLGLDQAAAILRGVAASSLRPSRVSSVM